jgi:tRNA G46 methylase TrmB
MAGFGHLFRSQAASYAAFRPVYPRDLYSRILNFANLVTHDTALDIATGSGQAARELSKHFNKVTFAGALGLIQHRAQ